jgi:acetyl esterase/lipase
MEKQQPEIVEDVPNLDDTTMDASSLWTKDSNFRLWKSSKWNKSPIQRLFNPITGVVNSKTFAFHDKSPKFLITVNKADHLCDEGIALAKALKNAGAPAILFEHSGLHVFGSMIDTKGNKQRLEAWLEAIYGSQK